jgi:glycosyltransferase involved in cell wall biosynthesis
MLAERRPRILHVVQPTTGGAAVCVRHLVAAGIGHGYSVTVACPNNGDLPVWSREAGATWVHIPMVRTPRLSDLAGLPAVRRLIRRADIVHLHASKAGAVARLALLTMKPDQRPPCIFTPHGWSWHVGGRLARVYQTFERATCGLADVIIAVSDDDRAVGIEALGRGASRVRVISNGVDTEWFKPDGAHAEMSDHPLIVCVGRFTEAKGQDLAVRSLALMKIAQARLRLVGDGADRDDLVRLATHLGVLDRLEIVGSVADTAPHMRAADIVVIPSRWDAQSLVLLEAMACGCAIVATRVPGVTAIDGAGEIVESREPAAMAATLDRLAEDPTRRAALGRAARARAVAEFGLDASLSQYLALWRSLTEGSGDRGRPSASRRFTEKALSNADGRHLLRRVGRGRGGSVPDSRSTLSAIPQAS